MSIRPVTDKRIAETSSKGNQEKWYDRETDRWYKLDQFGYEALEDIKQALLPALEYYPRRDWGIIMDRVKECIFSRQKAF